MGSAPQCLVSVSRLRTRRRLYLLIATALFLSAVYYIRYVWGVPKVSIVVVEEHHEVLPYWFEAAKVGYIKSRGNTLLHIDGHSDDAPPEYFEGYPFFKWPSNEQDIAMMMQRNDVFIVAAIMTGLINRFIWIWPPWDYREHDVDHLKLRGYIGWATVHGPEGEEKIICDCKQVIGQTEVECQFLNYSSSGADIEVTIEHRKCKPQAEYVGEYVRESVAMKMLQNQNWIKKNESIILDIDEDYYGCESGTEVLFESGIEFKTLQSLNRIVGRFLCPRDAHHEKLADKLMYELINAYLRNCGWNADDRCMRDASFMRRSLESYVLKAWLKYPGMFCTANNIALMKTWRNVSTSLYSFKKPHLVSIRDTGFCMSISSKTLIFESEPNGFRVCHGFNTPGDTVVTLHSPSITEVAQRSRNLRKMLADLGRVKPPGITTVCRSFRDGYLPKKYFSEIESAVIDGIKLTGYHGAQFKVIYDDELLGGERGWPSRHHDSKKSLFV